MISCNGCGLCCMWESQPPFGDGEEKPDIEITPNPFNTPCCWLDLETKKCKHYEHRPKICRDFQLGGSDCVELRRRANI